MNNNTYIISLEVSGKGTFFLQMRKVINWYFNDNCCKTFKTIKTAKKNADILLHKIRDCKSVHVLSVVDGDFVSVATVKNWYGTEKEAYVAENKES